MLTSSSATHRPITNDLPAVTSREPDFAGRLPNALQLFHCTLNVATAIVLCKQGHYSLFAIYSAAVPAAEKKGRSKSSEQIERADRESRGWLRPRVVLIDFLPPNQIGSDPSSMALLSAIRAGRRLTLGRLTLGRLLLYIVASLTVILLFRSTWNMALKEETFTPPKTWPVEPPVKQRIQQSIQQTTSDEAKELARKIDEKHCGTSPCRFLLPVAITEQGALESCCMFQRAIG